MAENINALRKNVEELFIQEKFDVIIKLITDEMLDTQKDAELYLLRGNTWNKKKDYDKAIIDYNKAIKINPKNTELYIWIGNTWYNKKDYNKAIANYNKAIKINPNYELAFYNKGAVWVAKKEYNKAIADYTKAIDVNSNYADAYVSRGNIKRVFNGDYDGAIADYTDAIKINIDVENAYYYRGFAYYKKALNETTIDLPKSRQDFEKYLGLTSEKNNDAAKYAKLYIEELKDVIEDPNLWFIKQLVNNIKDKLWIRKESCITHYTSLSVLKDLIFDKSKFRISEGNFMNDPSEGEEFFKFIKYKPDTFHKASPSTESVSPKPFIGSFVTKDKCNNLNMWRFYGKEKGEEAKGCAITLRTEEFIENIENSLSNEKNKEARLENESDIKFCRVVYVVHDGAPKFYIPNLDKNEDSNTSEELEKLMKELKNKLEPYKKGNNRTLEKYINSIAFLFKNDAYKNEDEVRLVMNGIELEKKYNMGLSSPKVYIELVPIKDIVSQITLGPKVDKVSEWFAAFHYSYEKMKAPKIDISQVPFK